MSLTVQETSMTYSSEKKKNKNYTWSIKYLENMKIYTVHHFFPVDNESHKPC